MVKNINFVKGPRNCERVNYYVIKFLRLFNLTDGMVHTLHQTLVYIILVIYKL
jgi:hypothetical protein